MTFSSFTYFVVSLLSMALVLLSLLITIYYLSRKVSVGIRINMDELPPALVKIWWMVNFFQYYAAQYIPKKIILNRKKLLSSAGLDFFLNPLETFALQIIGTILGFSFSILTSVSSGLSLSTTVSICTVTSAIGCFYPIMWLNDQKKKRISSIMRSIPSFLDVLTLCCECGLSFNAGLINYCEKGPKGPLRFEMERVLRDVKGGSSRIESLHKLATRMANADLTMFVSIVVQSEKMGVPLGESLRRFSEQKRTERFQRAEKLGMEAPMKIIGPLVIFIFPITFILIAFPIIVSVMEGLD